MKELKQVLSYIGKAELGGIVLDNAKTEFDGKAVAKVKRLNGEETYVVVTYDKKTEKASIAYDPQANKGLIVDILSIYSYKYENDGNINQGLIFIPTGYIPTMNTKEITEELSQYGVGQEVIDEAKNLTDKKDLLNRERDNYLTNLLIEKGVNKIEIDAMNTTDKLKELKKLV